VKISQILVEHQRITISTQQTGFTIMVAYVSPAQWIKPYVIHPNEFHQTQAIERI